MDKGLRIGALVSGGGSNLQAIMQACQERRIDGQVVFVGADKAEAFGLERARQADIPTFVVDYTEIIDNWRLSPENRVLPQDFDLEQVLSQQALFSGQQNPDKTREFLQTRAIAEAQLLAHMEQYPYDLLVLAGFMRVLTPYFIDHVNRGAATPRIMNIHPALLPAFPGTDGYGDTFRYGCKVGGCTVHFVDYGEDTGPIVGQRAFPIEPEDSLETVRTNGLQLEWELYPQCIEWFAQDRLKLVEHEYRDPVGTLRRRKTVQIRPSPSSNTH